MTRHCSRVVRWIAKSFCLIVIAGGGMSSAAEVDSNAVWMAENYTKFEYRIPMRDGRKLFTRVYRPKDESTTWPILLTRTPYSLKPYGADAFGKPAGSARRLAEDKFILVSQDVRGRYGSEGEFVHVRPFNPNKGPRDIDESSDTYDTIDWLVKNIPQNNGSVGLFGISYPGFYAAMGMIDSHPALKAVSPQAPISDWFMGDDLNHNGAFFLSQNFGFMYRFAQKLEDPLHEDARQFPFQTPDGYDFFLGMGSLAQADARYFHGRVPEWNEFLAHPTYDDYWQARNILPHLKNVHCAVMVVGGWFDAEDLFGPLGVYRATEQLNPGITNILVMGPWTHGDWSRGTGEKLGPISFRAKTAEFYREKIELPFFRRFLKGDTNSTLHEAQVFETGTHRWRQFDAWPPRKAQSKTLYLQSGGRVSWEAPTQSTDDYDEYVSDPMKPVPYTEQTSVDYPRTYPIEDQRFAGRRPDVLVYASEPLEEDLTVVGPIEVELHVSTSGTDSDWVTKLIDVYPGDYPDTGDGVLGGYQQLVRGDVFRGKFRESFREPKPMEPGAVTPIRYREPDICHTFRRGHQVMVQVQSSWFPLVDRNPQTFVNIPTAKPEDFRRAHQRVYRRPGAASALTMRVLPNY